MKKLRLFLLTLVALLGGSYASAETVNNYTVDFNTDDDKQPFNTNDHAFQVASNWRHIVDTYEDYWSGNTTYASYSYSSTAGVDGSGALSCSTNQNSNSIYDLLVTPVVKGTVTIAAKATASYYTPQLTFYKITDNGDGTFTRGAQITVDVSAINATDYTTITIPVDEAGERIGIRSSYVWLDNFTATEATIVPEPKMTIASAVPTATTGTIYWNQQANGKVLVSYTVTVKNTGDVNLTQGDDGFSVSIINRSTGAVYATVAVPQDLANEETSDEFVVSAEVETSLWPNSYTYINMDLKENLFGSTVQRAQSHYKAYESKFVFREAGSTSTSSLTSVNWGIIREAQSKNFEIANLGTAPLTINSYVLTPNSTDGFVLTPGFKVTDLPEGITVDYQTQKLTMAGGAVLPFTVTKDETPGTYTGTLTIGYTPHGADATNFTLSFAATMIGANTWMADFNNTTSTAIYPQGSVKEGGITTDWDNKTSDGKYNIYLKGIANQTSYQTENNKFITPKLHAAAGDKLSFDVKAAYISTDDYFVKVYVSTDRQNWGDPVETYVYSNVGSSFTTKTVTFDTEGNYYVAFAIYGTGSGIDNLVGLEKVNVTHDLYIKSVNWPDASVKSGSALSKPSVDIIPLTDEDAANYTVKYIYGDNEVAIASKALTASASSTTSFAASFTPTVETTTTFPGTKVVFEFTDGTKFESETFDLTVTNEPIFHFQNSKYTSRWYEPSDYTTPYSFGKTNTADSKTFWIINWGSAPLTVKNIALPEGFTTSVSDMTLPAFDGTQNGLETCQQSFDITFSATEAGTFSGDMVITYVDGNGADQTFTLAVSGTKLDPSKFYATFGTQNSSTVGFVGLPAGSLVQPSVTVETPTTNNACLKSASSTKNLFITPKLTTTGENVQFDVKVGTSTGSVKVYSITNNIAAAETTTDEEFEALNPTLLGEFTIGTDVSNFTTYSVEAPAGEYYLAFKIADVYIDDIYGMTVVPVAHNWQIASSNIPTEAMQNVASTATLNIRNFGIAEEAADSYTVTAYVDGEAAGTGTAVAIPMNHKLTDAGTLLSVSFQSPKVGKISVYVELKAGDYSVQTDPVEVTFAAEQPQTEASVAGTTTSSNGPVYMGDKNCETVSLYTADILKAGGLKPGDKIKSIAFKGYNTNSATTSKFEVWYEWTDDQTLEKPSGELATEDNVMNMTKIADENERAWPVVGSSSNYVNLIEFDFSSNPLVYQSGKSLRIIVRNQAKEYGGKNFITTSYSNLYYKHSNDYSTYTSATWYSSTLPAIYFELVDQSSTLAGTVKNSTGTDIEGATVKLVADNGIEYSGTTNAEGNYTVKVIQGGLTYNVTADDGTVSATAKGVKFAEGNLTKNFVLGTVDLDGDATEAPADAVYASAKLNRTLNTGWNAVVLPFAVSAEELTSKVGEGYELAEYDGDEGDTNVTVNFKKATAIEANVPYLLWLEDEVTDPEFANVDLTVDEAKTEGTVFDFVGVYEKTDVNAGDYFMVNGKFKKATTNNKVLAYRSYLKLKNANSVRSLTFKIGDEEVTAIEGLTIDAATSTEGIYNMQGQKVDHLKKGGLYIKDGKKVLVK